MSTTIFDQLNGEFAKENAWLLFSQHSAAEISQMIFDYWDTNFPKILTEIVLSKLDTDLNEVHHFRFFRELYSSRALRFCFFDYDGERIGIQIAWYDVTFNLVPTGEQNEGLDYDIYDDSVLPIFEVVALEKEYLERAFESLRTFFRIDKSKFEISIKEVLFNYIEPLWQKQ